MTPQVYHFKASCGCAGTITQFCPEAKRLQVEVEAARAKYQAVVGPSKQPFNFEYFDAYDQAMQAFLIHMDSHAVHIRGAEEHYQATIESKAKKLHALVEKSGQQVLSEEEETELLKLDTFLESALHDHTALPLEKKNQLAVGRVEELISATDELLRTLKGGDGLDDETHAE